MPIPPPLDLKYTIADSADIRSWSFGPLTSPREAMTTPADNVAGTLHDQRIFGPIDDFRCACGKYSGGRYRNMICDRCGVKVASTAIRGFRLGHIEFPVPVPHPFAADLALHCWPVIPIRFIESTSGQPLFSLYDHLIEASASHSMTEICRDIASITNHLLPVTITSYNWGIAAADMLAQGMALKTQHGLRRYCAQCGYLIEGVEALQCPGCGAPLN